MKPKKNGKEKSNFYVVKNIKYGYEIAYFNFKKKDWFTQSNERIHFEVKEMEELRI